MQGRRNKEKMSTHLLGARRQDGGSQDHEQSDALAICLKLGEQAVAWLRSHLPATEIVQIYQKKKKKKKSTCITEQRLLVLTCRRIR